MPDRLIQRILAFVEFTARPDMSYAIRLAKQLGAELVLFGVIDTPAMVHLIGQHKAEQRPGATLTATLVEDAKRILQSIVDEAVEEGVTALGHAMVSEEVPEQILKEALLQHVDMIVVRSHGNSGMLKKLFDSTIEEILKAAPCPVLVAEA